MDTTLQAGRAGLPGPSGLPRARAARPRPRWLRAAAWASMVMLALTGCQTLPSLPDRGPGAEQDAHAAMAPQAPTATTEQVQPAPAQVLPVPLPTGSAVTLGVAPAAVEERCSPCTLWQRIIRGLSMPELTHPLVLQHAQRFAATGFLEKRADRIRLYMPLIVEETERRGLPLELALLPLVESALNPHAQSPVGALGPWQFMQPTARRFELRTSRLVDDRKNLHQATRAALDYLQKLHAQFGDWHLAMAAYNWGEGRVQRAVNGQRARGERADFNALAPSMPVETRNYVPQIMALALLVAQPQALGAQLPDIPDRNPLVEADLAHDTDLALVLRFAGMTQAEFLALNPAVKPPLVLAAATPRLLMPEPAAQRFEAAQAAHEGRTASFMVVQLQSTQPVDSIARAHGATAADVRAVNGIPRGTKPVLGSVLLLPGAVPAGTRTGDALVAAAQLTTVADVVRLQVRTRKGETPQRLAQRCSVDAASLADWNRLGRKQMGRPLPAGRVVLTLRVQREAPGACAAAAPQRPGKSSV